MRKFITLTVVVLTFGFAAGCNDKASEPAKSDAAKKESGEKGHKNPHEHEHEPGAHGGIVISIGSDNYHAEALFEKGGILRLYMLDQDETKVLEVDAQELTGYAKVEGSAESESFTLKPQPQSGDRPGMTSLFVGELPAGLHGRRVEVTIPAVRIGSERFRIAFKSAASTAHDMPAGVDAEEEKALYLTPGGKYTQDDIKANGGVVASVKFKGLKAEHDLHPKPGDKICPITLTKANPKFSWVINGKTYEFCCPPCVDEYVLLAKEKPEDLKDPEEFIKK